MSTGISLHTVVILLFKSSKSYGCVLSGKGLKDSHMKRFRKRERKSANRVDHSVDVINHLSFGKF